MRSYVLKKVTSAPDWDTIDALPIDNLQWTNPPVDIRAQGQLCWDEAAIYVRLRAWETEIRAEHSDFCSRSARTAVWNFSSVPPTICAISTSNLTQIVRYISDMAQM